jgi:hypothetical protein
VFLFKTPSLETSETDLAESQVTLADAAFYQSPMSEMIQPFLPPDTSQGRLSNVLRADHLWSVPIVSPNGIDRFLQRDQQLAEIEEVA